MALLAGTTEAEEKAAIQATTAERIAATRALQEMTVAREAAAAGEAVEEEAGAGGLGRTGVLAGVAGITAAVVATAKLVQDVRSGLAAAREAEVASARLSVALDGNAKKFAEVNAAIQATARASVSSEKDLADVAQRLLERGVKDTQIPRAVQLTADTAAALQIPLDAAAEDIARLYAGDVPRALARAVPELHKLSEAEREAGKGLDVLATAFQGRAAAFAATDAGKEVAATRDIQKAWEDIGKALLPIERTVLPHIAKLMGDVAQPFKADSLVTFKSVLNEMIAQVNGDLAFVGKLVANLLIEQPLLLASHAVQDIYYNAKSLVIDLFAYVEEKFHGMLETIANGFDDLTAKLPSSLGLATNLTATVQSLPSGLSDAATQANKDAKTAHAQVLQDFSTNPFKDAYHSAVDQRQATIEDTNDRLGTDLDAASAVNNKVAADAAAAKAAAKADAAQQRQKDMAEEADAFAALLNVRRSLSTKNRDEDTKADLADIKEQYDARTLTLEQYFARRRQLELTANDDELSDLAKQAVALTIKAAGEKLAGKPATDSLKELLEVTQKLLPLEAQRAKAAADITREENAAIKARKQLADELAKGDAERRGKADATIAGPTFAGRQAGNAAELAALAVEQQTELAGLKEKGATAAELDARAQTQATETQAKRVELAKQLLDAVQAEAEAAKQEYQRRLTENADLVRVGQLSPGAAQDSNAAALAEYQQQLGKAGTDLATAAATPGAAGLADKVGQLKLTITVDTADAKAKVNDFNAQLQDLGRTAQSSATQGLAKTLIDIELHSKSAGQAIKKLGEQFLETMVQAVNEKLAAAAVGAVTNVLTGSLSSVFGGVGGLLGFASGGYTGDAPADQVTGLVHGGEYVHDADTVKRLGVDVLAGIGEGRVSPATKAAVTASARPAGFVTSMIAADITRGMRSPTATVDAYAASSGRAGVGSDGMAGHTAATTALAAAARDMADAVNRPATALVDYGDLRAGVDRHMTAQGHRKFREYRAKTGG